jgi:hypothetical protein
MFINSNQAFLLVQKVEISPKGFTLGVKALIVKKKKLFNLPQGPPKADQKKKDTIMEFGKAICNPLGQCSKHLLIS